MHINEWTVSPHRFLRTNCPRKKVFMVINPKIDGYWLFLGAALFMPILFRIIRFPFLGESYALAIMLLVIVITNMIRSVVEYRQYEACLKVKSPKLASEFYMKYNKMRWGRFDNKSKVQFLGTLERSFDPDIRNIAIREKKIVFYGKVAFISLILDIIFMLKFVYW